MLLSKMLRHRVVVLLCAVLCAACQADPAVLPTRIVIPSATATATATPTATATFTALVSDTPTATDTPIASNTPTATLTPSLTPLPSATPTNTLTPTIASPATPLSSTPVRLLEVLNNVTLYTVARANVRVCPALECEVVEQLTSNVEVAASALVVGEAISGRNQWYLRAVGGGYLHISLVSLTPPDN